MPMDAGYDRWLRECLDRLDRHAGQLYAAVEKTGRDIDRIDGQLRAADSRNKALWNFVAALGVGVLGGVGFHLQRVAALETELRGVKESARKDAEDARAEIKELAKQLREHEFRASVPKPEPGK